MSDTRWQLALSRCALRFNDMYCSQKNGISSTPYHVPSYKQVGIQLTHVKKRTCSARKLQPSSTTKSAAIVDFSLFEFQRTFRYKHAIAAPPAIEYSSHRSTSETTCNLQLSDTQLNKRKDKLSMQTNHRQRLILTSDRTYLSPNETLPKTLTHQNKIRAHTPSKVPTHIAKHRSNRYINEARTHRHIVYVKRAATAHAVPFAAGHTIYQLHLYRYAAALAYIRVGKSRTVRSMCERSAHRRYI